MGGIAGGGWDTSKSIIGPPIFYSFPDDVKKRLRLKGEINGGRFACVKSRKYFIY